MNPFLENFKESTVHRKMVLILAQAMLRAFDYFCYTGSFQYTMAILENSISIYLHYKSFSLIEVDSGVLLVSSDRQHAQTSST